LPFFWGPFAPENHPPKRVNGQKEACRSGTGGEWLLFKRSKHALFGRNNLDAFAPANMGNGACIGFKTFTSFIAMAQVATGMADTAGTVYRGRGALPFAA
jgi:hypothetical protein